MGKVGFRVGMAFLICVVDFSVSTMTINKNHPWDNGMLNVVGLLLMFTVPFLLVVIGAFSKSRVIEIVGWGLLFLATTWLKQ